MSREFFFSFLKKFTPKEQHFLFRCGCCCFVVVRYVGEICVRGFWIEKRSHRCPYILVIDLACDSLSMFSFHSPYFFLEMFSELVELIFSCFVALVVSTLISDFIAKFREMRCPPWFASTFVDSDSGHDGLDSVID